MKKPAFLKTHRVRVWHTVDNLRSLKQEKPFSDYGTHGNIETCLVALSYLLNGDYSRACELANRAVTLVPVMINAPSLIVALAKCHRGKI